MLELQDVQFSNIVLDNAGRFLQVDASIRLKEYIPPTTTVSAKKAAQTDTAAESSNAGAMAATPSTTDKQNKKITTHSSGNTKPGAVNLVAIS